MIFVATEISDAYTIRLTPYEDERGSFARGWCQREFEEAGLPARVVQMNISCNRRKGTLRGFHYQLAPHQEDKLLRCVRGAVYDAVIDLRPHSATFMRHVTWELSEGDHRMLQVPKGCANAFLTLSDETEVMYFVSEFYVPSAERGVRWNDPAFKIRWPAEPAVISEKDRRWPDFLEGALPAVAAAARA